MKKLVLAFAVLLSLATGLGAAVYSVPAQVNAVFVGVTSLASATISSTLAVTGASTFTGLTTHNGGATVASGNLTVSTGNVAITAGTLAVGSTTTTTGLVTANGGVTVANSAFNLRRATISGASAPTCAATSGWGSSPSCAIDTGSSDTAGIMAVTVGGTPGTTETTTLTFQSTFGTNTPACTFTLMDGSTTWNAAATSPRIQATSTSSVVVATNNTAAPGAGTLRFAYHCFGK